MAWEGYSDDASDVGDGWNKMDNCSFYVKGECRRRLGFGGKIDLSTAVVRSAGELGAYCLVATAAGAVLSITQSTAAVASLTTGLDTTNWGTFAPGNGRLYYTNGVDALRVSDAGTTIRTAGITAPGTIATATTTGSGGVVDAGVHLVRYRYYDSSRNRLSDPSVAASVTITAGQKISAGYTTISDATVDKIIVEITAVGASTYYRVATVTNATSSTTVDVSDANLILGVAATRDGEFQHQPPPVIDIILEHRQREFGLKLSTATLYWSRAIYPESWDSVNYTRAVTMDAGDAPTGMCSFYSDLYIFGNRSMRRVIYSSDPAAAQVQDVPGNLGVFHQRCIAKIDGGLMIGWGRNGAWMIDAMQPKKISKEIDTTLSSLASSTNLTQRFVCYEPTRREVVFVFPLSGSTTCKAAFAWSLDTQQWTLWRWRNAMTAGVINTQYTDRARLTLFDASGFGWRVGAAVNDGTDSGTVNVTAGSTTTVINGTNTALVGQILYRPGTAEERTITAASGSQITVAALATAPTAGEVLYVGSIRRRMLTKWSVGDGIDEKRRPRRFMIALRPSGTMGSATVAYYQDFSATPVTLTSFAADTDPSGVTITNNATSAAVDFDVGGGDGYVGVPMPADWKRAIQADIIMEEPEADVIMLDASFSKEPALPASDE